MWALVGAPGGLFSKNIPKILMQFPNWFRSVSIIKSLIEPQLYFIDAAANSISPTKFMQFHLKTCRKVRDFKFRVAPQCSRGSHPNFVK